MINHIALDAQCTRFRTGLGFLVNDKDFVKKKKKNQKRPIGNNFFFFIHVFIYIFSPVFRRTADNC